MGDSLEQNSWCLPRWKHLSHHRVPSYDASHLRVYAKQRWGRKGDALKHLRDSKGAITSLSLSLFVILSSHIKTHLSQRLNSSWLIVDGKTEYTGTLQRFVQDRSLTLTWKASDWPALHSSVVTIKFSPWMQTTGDNSCLVWIQQIRVPSNRMKETNAFWEKLWNAIYDAVKPR